MRAGVRSAPLVGANQKRAALSSGTTRVLAGVKVLRWSIGNNDKKTNQEARREEVQGMRDLTPKLDVRSPAPEEVGGRRNRRRTTAGGAQNPRAWR
jgi:hypothetical protein